jgi:hypothetical protein
VAADSITDERKADVKEWFELLEFVLPCKFCRASFHDYIYDDPLTDETIANTELFGNWVYRVHNRVNAKLRDQGLLTKPNPTWRSVRARYEELYKTICAEQLGWDFLVSVAYATPGPRSPSSPLPLPKGITVTDASNKAERNRYNLLTWDERLQYLKRWWRLIPSILPCPEWRRSWKKAYAECGEPPLAEGRAAVMRWMWRIEDAVCSCLRCPTPHASHPDLCRRVAAYESGCSKAKRARTCRKHKTNRLQTKTRRRSASA